MNHTSISIYRSIKLKKKQISDPNEPFKVIRFHKSPSMKRLFDFELLNRKL